MLIGSAVETRIDLYFGVRCAGHGVPAWHGPGPNCHLGMKVGDVAMVFDQSRDGEVVDRVILWHRHCVEARLLVAVPDADAYRGETCQDCSRPVTDPEDLFVFSRGRNVFIDRELVWHRHCVAAALDSAPKEKQRGRNRGKLWVAHAAPA